VLRGVVGILDDALPNDAEVIEARHKLESSQPALSVDVPLDNVGVVRSGSAPDVFLGFHVLHYIRRCRGLQAHPGEYPEISELSACRSA